MKKMGLILIVVLMIMMLTGCGGDKSELNVYNWGDYIDTDVIDIFENEYDIEVNYREYPTNEEMYIKVKSGAGDYDVIFPSDYMIEKMMMEGMLAKIDTSKLENYGHIGSSFKGLAYDEKNEYSVPYFWGTLGILYNETMVEEPVESWDILFDEKYSKQILMLDSQRDSMAVALKRMGYSLNTTDDSELEQAKQMLILQKPLVLAYVVDEVKNMMVQGEAALAVTWSGEAIDVLDGTDDVKYAVPKEGSNLWFDSMVIPENSPNKEEAMLFIDFLCRPEIALINTEYVGYSTPNMTAYDELDDEIKSMDSYYPNEAVLENCEVFVDLGEYNNVVADLWLEVKAAK
jgi:spermidine/putrescine transport system substrate-binding protein